MRDGLFFYLVRRDHSAGVHVPSGLTLIIIFIVVCLIKATHHTVRGSFLRAKR